MVLIEFLVKKLRTSTTLYGLIVARTYQASCKWLASATAKEAYTISFAAVSKITSTRTTFSQMAMKDLCSSPEVDTQRQMLDGDERIV